MLLMLSRAIISERVSRILMIRQFVYDNPRSLVSSKALDQVMMAVQSSPHVDVSATEDFLHELVSTPPGLSTLSPVAPRGTHMVSNTGSSQVITGAAEMQT